MDDITAIESVRTYLDIRSELIDVGSMPKLVINGVPHPTSIQAT